MSDLAATPAFTKLAGIGEGGGVRVRLRQPALVSVLARAGKTDLLADKVQAVFGLPLADRPKRSVSGGIAALGIGPGRWLFAQEEGGEDFLATLAVPLAGLASLSDHSDGYAVLEVEGPAVRKALAKGVPLDLHPDVYGTGDVAVTVIAHIGAILWREGQDRFVIAVFRSYAESFWHWLSSSAAEYGLEPSR